VGAKDRWTIWEEVYRRPSWKRSAKNVAKHERPTKIGNKTRKKVGGGRGSKMLRAEKRPYKMARILELAFRRWTSWDLLYEDAY
jgi:hypothetical protein